MCAQYIVLDQHSTGKTFSYNPQTRAFSYQPLLLSTVSSSVRLLRDGRTCGHLTDKSMSKFSEQFTNKCGTCHRPYSEEDSRIEILTEAYRLSDKYQGSVPMLVVGTDDYSEEAY